MTLTEVWQVRGVGLGDSEAVSEEVPEGDAQFGTGQQQAEEGVAAITALIGAGSARDLALDHLRPEIALGAVGVRRHLGMVSTRSNSSLGQPVEQPVERGEPGAAAEDPVEAGAQRRPPAWVAAIGLEIGAEPPNQRAGGAGRRIAGR